MNKRGQVFILAAILLAVILFSLAAIRNKSEQRQIKGDFEALSENYQIEASKLINSAIKSGGDVHKEFREFSTMFAAYAKGKNPEYGLIYILNFGDNLQIVNFLDREITIQDECDYSVTINGSFSKVPANLDFENFNIGTSVVWGEINSECKDLGIPSGDIPPLGSYFCVNINTTGSTDFQVIIDGVGYYHCAEKGVPDIMMVSKMKQGEQAKVSSSGKCINQDYCGSFNLITYPDPIVREGKCNDCSGGACFWWPLPACMSSEGLCLSKFSYPTRDPSVAGGCSATCNKICVGDRIFYKDDCDPPNPIFMTSDGDCESKIPAEVCRNAQCCKEHASKQCCDDDICWFNDCNPPTQEGTESCGTGKGCRGADSECCDLKSDLKCDGDSIYYYSSCDTKESFVKDCTSGDFDVCRDKYYTGGGTLPDTTRCCIQNYELKCDGDKVYHYSSCGTKEGLKEDCIGQNKVCEDGECITPPYKQFKCQKTKTFYKALEEYECDSTAECTEHCRDLTGNQESTCSSYHIHSDDECTVVCVYPEWTECDENPSCGSEPKWPVLPNEQTC